MNLTLARRGADYLYKLCVKGATAPEQIPYYPQKTESMATRTPDPMPRLYAPESVGMSSQHIERFLHALEQDRYSHVHNLLIYRKEKLICAASAPGYSPRVWSLTHSMAKTVTSFALAILLDRGQISLDARVCDLLADDLPKGVSARTRRITVRHLLTMTAGVTDVGEAAIVTLADWKRAFLSCTPAYEPGKRFFYNSINTYVLACIIERVSGQGLDEFLDAHLFRPMGIRNYYMEKSPQGTVKGGWGMYLTPLDMAKLGRLTLQGGRWQGKQLISEGYLAEATVRAVPTSTAYGDYDYGYHLWSARDGSAYLLNGMLGQNVWVNPKTETVIVCTAGNDEFFQQSNNLRLIAAYFGADYTPAKGSLGVNLLATASLRRAEQNFFAVRWRLPQSGRHEDCFSRPRRLSVPREAEQVLGAVYEVEKNNVGLLPFALRLMQNNHSPGITKLSFSQADGRFYVHLTEGEEERVLEGGFGGFRYTELTYKGEKYLAGTLLSFVENEDGEPLLKIDVIFPELPNTRRIKLHLGQGKNHALALTESPGVELLDSVLDCITANGAITEKTAGVARRLLAGQLLWPRVLHSMEPVLYVTEERAEGEETSPVEALRRRRHQKQALQKAKNGQSDKK